MERDLSSVLQPYIWPEREGNAGVSEKMGVQEVLLEQFCLNPSLSMRESGQLQGFGHQLHL